jgi:hypothetical protein
VAVDLRTGVHDLIDLLADCLDHLHQVVGFFLLETEIFEEFIVVYLSYCRAI